MAIKILGKRVMENFTVDTLELTTWKTLIYC